MRTVKKFRCSKDVMMLFSFVVYLLTPYAFISPFIFFSLYLQIAYYRCANHWVSLECQP